MRQTPSFRWSQTARPLRAMSLFNSDKKASRDICPRSSPLRERTATSCAATSLSPTTSWKGSFTLAVPLKLSSGGANKSLTASAGSIAYSDADSLEFTSVGSNGQLLQSAGTGTPVWSSTLVSPTSSGDLTLSNGGIKFPATQVLSADANTLDDYEEGTFTPTISGGTTAGAGTYSIQVGDYVKIE